MGNPSFDSRHTSIRVVNSTGIDLSGVTLDQTTVRGSLVYGVLYWNATGTLDANRYTHTSPPDLSNYSFVAHARAVDAPYNASNRAAVAFTKAVHRHGPRGNQRPQLGPSHHHRQYVPEQRDPAQHLWLRHGIGSTATRIVSSNTISGYNVPANDDGESAGIYIESAFTTDLRGGPVIAKSVTVTNNEIFACQYGAWGGLGYAGLGGPMAISTSFSGNRVHDIAPSVPGQPSGGLLMEDVDKTYGSSNTLSASSNTLSNARDSPTGSSPPGTANCTPR